jgi:dTDP-4-amino-4,6-dideoxygalactose transaminase
VHFIPIFYFSYWKNLYADFTEKNFPNAAKQYSQTITLPLWPDMTDEMVETVIKTVEEIGKECHA